MNIVQEQTNRFSEITYLACSPVGSESSNLMCVGSKQKEIVLTNFFPDLNIGTVQSSNEDASIHGELHVTGTTGFHTRSTVKKHKHITQG